LNSTWKNNSKELIKKALFKSKLYRLNSMANRCYILMYHMVPKTPTGFYAEVSKNDFEIHIAHLAKNYNIISLTEYVKKVRENETLRGCVVITFDDGFKDNYLNAYPILKKYNVPATTFLLTGRIEDGEAPWFIKFRYMFMKTTKSHLKISFNDVSFDLSMKSNIEKKTASTKIMLYMQKLPDEQRLELLDIIDKELKVDDYTEIEDTMLTWDEIKEMSDNKIEFGAHTMNHPILSRISFSKAEEEITKSKIIIEEKLGKQVSTFAYPFGKNDQYNDDTIKILKKLSFDCSVTTESGPTNHKSDLFEISRCFQGVVRLHDCYWKPYS